MSASTAAITAARCARHVTESVVGLLPAQLRLVGTAEQLVLVDADSGRTVATQSVRTPSAGDADTVRVFAHHLLSDVQDLVVTHLRTPWPLSSDGAPQQVWTALEGRTVRLGFARAGTAADRATELPAFRLPSGGQVRTAG